MQTNIFKTTVIALLLAGFFSSCQKPADAPEDNFAGITLTTNIVRHVYFWMAGTGSVTIDWGDKTPVETFELTPFKEDFGNEIQFQNS